MVRRRAAVIVFGNDKVLLMHRKFQGMEYYCFPGGMVEPVETPEQAAVRECMEETSIIPELGQLSFRLSNRYRDIESDEYFFFATSYTGEIALGGEEKDRSSADNYYDPQWVPIETFNTLSNVFPAKAYEEARAFTAGVARRSQEASHA